MTSDSPWELIQARQLGGEIKRLERLDEKTASKVEDCKGALAVEF